LFWYVCPLILFFKRKWEVVKFKIKINGKKLFCHRAMQVWILNFVHIFIAHIIYFIYITHRRNGTDLLDTYKHTKESLNIIISSHMQVAANMCDLFGSISKILYRDFFPNKFNSFSLTNEKIYITFESSHIWVAIYNVLPLALPLYFTTTKFLWW
jgi:hypothetical protein